MQISEQPAARTPAVQLLLQGYPITGVISARVSSNNFYAADLFDLELSLDSDPEFGACFWSGVTDTELEVCFRVSCMTPFCSVIRGRPDVIRIDPTLRTVQVQGRDLAGRLIDTAMAETFMNRTASELAASLATRHGLTPIITNTQSIIGRYYRNERELLTLNAFSSSLTQWDFLSRLAQQEGFDLFVSGTELHFESRSTSFTPRASFRPEDLIELKMDRMLPLATGIEVTVKSWNSRDHLAIVETVTSGTSAANDRESGPRTLSQVLIRPNLDSQSARSLAYKRLREIQPHDRTIRMLMPGDVDLAPRDVIQLEGTDSLFDSLYRIESVDRRFSTRSGFVQRVCATSA